MKILRVVPNLTVPDITAALPLYRDVLGMEVVMDHGWIVTLASPERADVQLSLITRDRTAPVNPAVSIGVDDVEAARHAAQRAGLEIVYPLTDEPWGVRRFFVRTADGSVINIVAHSHG